MTKELHEFINTASRVEIDSLILMLEMESDRDFEEIIMKLSSIIE